MLAVGARVRARRPGRGGGQALPGGARGGRVGCRRGKTEGPDRRTAPVRPSEGGTASVSAAARDLERCRRPRRLVSYGHARSQLGLGGQLVPVFREIVAGVPDLGRYLTLGELEHSTDLLRRRASRDRGLVTGRFACRAPAALSRDPRRPPAGALSSACRTPKSPSAPLRSSTCCRCSPMASPPSSASTSPSSRRGTPTRRCSTSPGSTSPTDLTGFLLRVYRPPLQRPVRVDVPGELQALRLHAAPSGGGGGDEGHRPPSARLLYAAAQLDVQRRVLLPVGGGRAASGRPHRRHGGGGLPPDCGEPEMPYLRSWRPGSSAGSASPRTTSSTRPTGPTPRSSSTFGTSSDDYAETMWDCFTLVSEVPLLHQSPHRRPEPRRAHPSRGQAPRPRGPGTAGAGCTNAT